MLVKYVSKLPATQSLKACVPRVAPVKSLGMKSRTCDMHISSLYRAVYTGPFWVIELTSADQPVAPADLTLTMSTLHLRKFSNARMPAEPRSMFAELSETVTPDIQGRPERAPG